MRVPHQSTIYLGVRHRTSCQMKAEIDPRRARGGRSGAPTRHTFGHAIEAWAGYTGEVLHGEGVALGMALAGQFSFGQGYCGSQVGLAAENSFRRVQAASEFRGPSQASGPRANALTS